MARAARSTSKKAKDDSPPLIVIVENGRLVPAYPADAERLASYSNGAKLEVTVSRGGKRIQHNIWYALLGGAVKTGRSPWDSAEAADTACRIALDMTELSKTVTGQFMLYPASLWSFTDKELDEKIELLKAIILRVTGVDPNEFRKHYGYDGTEGFQSSSSQTPEDGAGSGVEATPLDAGAHPDPEGAETGGNDAAGAPEGSGSDTASNSAAAASTPPQGETAGDASASTLAAPAGDELSDQDRDWLKLTAKMLVAATGPGEPSVLAAQVRGIMDNHTPKTADGKLAVSAEAIRIAQQINELCKEVANSKNGSLDMKVIGLMVGLTAAELRPREQGEPRHE